jgi:NAD(P)-dependent dehydrogenase (short-subunit alcohol dehydrogenase family)
MPRQRDTTLADTFTPTLHSSPYPTISPSNPSNHFTDRQPLNVCIIGASRGIGAEVAYAYARAGASSIILAGLPLSVEEGRLRDVVQRCRDVARKSWPGREGRLRVEGFAVDVAEAESVRGLVEGARAWLVEGNEGVDGQEVERARLDVLVLVSGWSGPVVLKVGDGETRDFGAVLDVNVKVS